MKLIVILLLVGYASATLLESFKRETRGTETAFANGLNRAIPLHIALGVEDSEEVQRLERGIKEELQKHIKEAFEKTLKIIEDAVEQGKQVNQAALDRLRDLRDKMVDFNIGDDEIKEGLEVMKKKVDDHLRHILEKMGLFDKRSAEPLQPDLLEGVLGDLNIRDMFLKLKKMILEKIDTASVKTYLAKLVGEGSEAD